MNHSSKGFNESQTCKPTIRMREDEFVALLDKLKADYKNGVLRFSEPRLYQVH